MLSGYSQAVRRRLCFLFGHVPTDIDFEKMTARCAWCGAELYVSYDMCSGETVITGVVRK